MLARLRTNPATAVRLHLDPGDGRGDYLLHAAVTRQGTVTASIRRGDRQVGLSELRSPLPYPAVAGPRWQRALIDFAAAGRWPVTAIHLDD